MGPTTARLPEGCEERLVPVRTPATAGVTGWCLELHDLIVSKLVAGRPKDLDFVRVAASLADWDTLAARLADTPVEQEIRTLAESRLRALA